MVLAVLVASALASSSACVDGVTPDCADAAAGCGSRDASADSSSDASSDGGAAS